jgi:hypothetical protein
MEQDTFLVRPLGKYGRIYILSKPQYLCYAIYIWSLYLILGSLLFIEIAIPTLCQDYIAWLCNLPSSVILLAVLIGFAGQLKLASLGRATDGNEKAHADITTTARTRRRALKATYLVVASISSILFTLILLLSMKTRIEHNLAIPLWGYMVLIVSAYIPFHCYRKWRSER